MRVSSALYFKSITQMLDGVYIVYVWADQFAFTSDIECSHCTFYPSHSNQLSNECHANAINDII